MTAKIKIEYLGSLISLNEYKSLHWRSLKKKIDPLKYSFNALISKVNPPKLEYMELRVFHNTRLDLDNIAGTIKIFVDCLRYKKVLPKITSIFGII